MGVRKGIYILRRLVSRGFKAMFMIKASERLSFQVPT